MVLQGEEEEKKRWMSLLVSGLVVVGPGGTELLAGLVSLLPDEGMAHHGVLNKGKHRYFGKE